MQSSIATALTPFPACPVEQLTQRSAFSASTSTVPVDSLIILYFCESNSYTVKIQASAKRQWKQLFLTSPPPFQTQLYSLEKIISHSKLINFGCFFLPIIVLMFENLVLLHVSSFPFSPSSQYDCITHFLIHQQPAASMFHVHMFTM